MRHQFDDVAYGPLSVFMGAIGGKERFQAPLEVPLHRSHFELHGLQTAEGLLDRAQLFVGGSVLCYLASESRLASTKEKHALARAVFFNRVRFQAITGNGIHDSYGRGEKVPGQKVKEIGAGRVAGGCGRLRNCA